MHAATTRHIVKKLLQDLNSQAKKIKKSFHKHPIHAYRVEVKKLRAFLRLLSSNNGNNDSIKLPGKIKKIYSVLGKIRDAQLQIKEIKKTYRQTKGSAPTEYLLLLKQQVKQHKKECRWLLKEKHLISGRKKIYKKLPSALPYKNTRRFLHQKIENILMLVNKGLQHDNDLHSIRKNLKDIIYINELYKLVLNDGAAAKPLKVPAHEKAMALAEQLGTFVDKWVSLSMLKHGWLNKIGAQEKKQLQFLYERWKTEKRSIRQSVSNRLNATDLVGLMNE